MPAPRLRIATCATLPEPDVDEAPLLAALAAAGVDAHMAAWDDPAPATPWEAPIPTVIRSTWNYPHAHQAFLDWIERLAVAGVPLTNPPDLLRWNSHKRYLADLDAAGLPVVPTLFVGRGPAAARAPLAELAAARGWNRRRLVIKPAVGAGSFATRRFDDAGDPAAQAFLDELAATRDVMVQPYLDSVEGHGERALVWIAGAFTHAVRKSPRFLDDDESVSAAVAIEPDELAVAEAVLAPRAARLLYGRVDLARDAAGKPMVMELELIEPSLFLLQHPPALERLVDALYGFCQADLLR